MALAAHRWSKKMSMNKRPTRAGMRSQAVHSHYLFALLVITTVRSFFSLVERKLNWHFLWAHNSTAEESLCNQIGFEEKVKCDKQQALQACTFLAQSAT